jgi:hypothetical protein
VKPAQYPHIFPSISGSRVAAYNPKMPYNPHFSTSTVYWSAPLGATTVVFLRILNIIDSPYAKRPDDTIPEGEGPRRGQVPVIQARFLPKPAGGAENK